MVHVDADIQSNIPVVTGHPLLCRAAPTKTGGRRNKYGPIPIDYGHTRSTVGYSIAPPMGPTMPKLAIYVPKKAKKEIDRWRKRINFSQVFMRALENEIRELQRAIDADDSQLTTAAQHYRRQMAGDRDALVSLGHAEGVRLVLECQLDSDAIHTMVQWSADGDLEIKQCVRVSEILGKEVESLVKSAKKMGYRADSHPGLEADLFRGVVRGVTDAWGRVCEQMNQL